MEFYTPEENREWAANTARRDAEIGIANLRKQVELLSYKVQLLASELRHVVEILNSNNLFTGTRKCAS